MQQLNLNQVTVAFVYNGKIKVIRHVAIMHSFQFLHTQIFAQIQYGTTHTLNKVVILDMKAGGGCTILYCA